MSANEEPETLNFSQTAASQHLCQKAVCSMTKPCAEFKSETCALVLEASRSRGAAMADDENPDDGPGLIKLDMRLC